MDAMKPETKKMVGALVGGVAGYVGSSYVGVSPLVGAAVGAGAGYLLADKV